MIFAKLDVCFWRHKKFKRAGVAACGYYAAALAYLRDEESPDGVLEHDVLGQLLDVGPRQAKKLVSKLVQVGLLDPHERGYYLVRYAEKNETREQIDARRSATRDRQAAFRVKRSRSNVVTNGVHTDESNALVADAQRALVTGSGSDSGSVSSGSLFGERSEGTPSDEPVTAKRKRSTKAPTSVQADAPDFCRRWGLPLPEAGSECADFLDYWSSRDDRNAGSTDWSARWRCRPDWTKKTTSGPSVTRLRAVPMQPDGDGWKAGDGT